MVFMVISMVIIGIMVIMKLARVTSIKSSVGILTYQSHISQVLKISVNQSVSDQYHFQSVLWRQKKAEIIAIGAQAIFGINLKEMN